MRLTPPLCKQSRIFWYKAIWKKKSKYQVIPIKPPEILEEMGIKPVDAASEFNPKPEKQVWIPPNDPRFMFPPRLEDEKNYHKKKAYTFCNADRLWEGVKQVQSLTNTVVTEGLPIDIAQSTQPLPAEHADHLMQRLILQSNLWDTTREKLPRRKKPDDISIMNYKAEIGIPAARSVDIMLRSLALKSSQLLSASDPSVVMSKRLLDNHQLSSVFFHGDDAVHASCTTDVLWASKVPVQKYADEDKVDATRDMSVPDIFPLAATIDLTKSHIYSDSSSLGYLNSFPYTNHHTLFLSMNREWRMDQRHASALLMSYCHCVEQAKRRGSELQEPIVIHSVHTDGESFGYTCFQLNTLQTDPSKQGIKNMAWTDADRLYEKTTPRRAMLRNTKYDLYNPDVIHKVLAIVSQ